MHHACDRFYHKGEGPGRKPVYDLHMHSTVSDGVLTPSALVRRVAENGIDIMALTDHDSTDGVMAARKAAVPFGVQVIAGAEVSVSWRGCLLHILALNVDPHEPGLQDGLKGLRAKRAIRAEAMGKRLSSFGLEGCLEGARAFAKGASISRSHFAADLVARGIAKDKASVFKRFLRPGKPGYVSCEWAGLGEAISWIKAAGGRAVIAHPGRYRLSQSKMRQLCQEFKDLGGDGIEVVSGSHGPHENQMASQMARKFGLLASQGSDFHEPAQTWLGFGALPAIPEDLTPVWHGWRLDSGHVTACVEGIV